MLTDACGDSTIDLLPSPSPLPLSLAADSGMTTLDSIDVNTRARYRCTMGLRVRGSSTISGATALWTGGSYRLLETGSDGPVVILSVDDLVGWFGADRVPPGELVTATRVFESPRPFSGVTISIQVHLIAQGEPPGPPEALSTSFGCG